MKTFQDLKRNVTPEFIKKLVELAEGFESVDSLDGAIGLNISMIEDDYWMHVDRFLNNYRFPLLLHRAVEGWNNINLTNMIVIDVSELLKSCGLNRYKFNKYFSCHLTPYEMAILDCLQEVLK